MEKRIFPLPGGDGIDLDEFKKMSHEQKCAKVKEAFEKINGTPSTKGVLYNPITKEVMDISSILGTPDETAAVEAVVNCMEDETIMHQVIKREEIQQIADNIRNGKASLKDLQAAEILSSISREEQEGAMVVQNVTSMIIQVAKFTQEERNYRSRVSDYLVPIMSVFSLQGLLSGPDSGCLMGKYKSNPEAMSDLVKELGDDIMEEWTSTATSVPDNLTLAMALITKAIDLTQDIEVSHLKEIEDLVSEASNVEFEIVNGERDGNGSNGTPNMTQANVYDPNNDEMKNILRD